MYCVGSVCIVWVMCVYCVGSVCIVWVMCVFCVPIYASHVLDIVGYHYCAYTNTCTYIILCT